MSEDSYQIVVAEAQGLRVEIDIDESKVLPVEPP